MNPDAENLLDALKSISEMISENKDRRGRPAKHTPKDYEPFAPLRAKTPRGKQNYIYATRATTVLAGNRERFAYLLEPKFRTTILAEIGRINHPSVMVSVASEICTTRMKTAKAVGLCRRMRVKGSPNANTLAKKIRRTIQDYRDRHPNLSEADITTALRMAAYQ